MGWPVYSIRTSKHVKWKKQVENRLGPAISVPVYWTFRVNEHIASSAFQIQHLCVLRRNLLTKSPERLNVEAVA